MKSEASLPVRSVNCLNPIIAGWPLVASKTVHVPFSSARRSYGMWWASEDMMSPLSIKARVWRPLSNNAHRINAKHRHLFRAWLRGFPMFIFASSFEGGKINLPLERSWKAF